MINIEKETDYTAYIKRDNEQGYLTMEWGQGEYLFFLSNDLEEANYFYHKEQLINFLKEEGYEYNEIIIIERTITKKTEFKKIIK